MNLSETYRPRVFVVSEFFFYREVLKAQRHTKENELALLNQMHEHVNF